MNGFCFLYNPSKMIGDWVKFKWVKVFKNGQKKIVEDSL